MGMIAVSSINVRAVAPPVAVVTTAAAPIAEVLAGLDDLDLLAIVGSLPQASERRRAACEVLVGRYQGFVRSCVHRYSAGPEPFEDLMQVGYLGLIKAINNFDPAVGRSLGAYAHPFITGELKRHFRDKRWQLHVTRSAKEMSVRVRESTWQLTHELGRMPLDSDLVSHLGISTADLREAYLATMAFQPASLDAPVFHEQAASSMAEFLGAEDARLDRMLSMQAVAAHWGELPWRERQILQLRFYGGMTQSQIGEHLGISQMHVSRLLSHALGYLRLRLLDLPS
jgi:RNA polymerase sigma-70 factor (sigma-B/F/G subfamily)